MYMRGSTTGTKMMLFGQLSLLFYVIRKEFVEAYLFNRAIIFIIPFPISISIILLVPVL